MNTADGVLSVIGELRQTIAMRDEELNELRRKVGDVVDHNNALTVEISHLKNSVKRLSEDLLKDTVAAK